MLLLYTDDVDIQDNERSESTLRLVLTNFFSWRVFLKLVASSRQVTKDNKLVSLKYCRDSYFEIFLWEHMHQLFSFIVFIVTKAKSIKRRPLRDKTTRKYESSKIICKGSCMIN